MTPLHYWRRRGGVSLEEFVAYARARRHDAFLKKLYSRVTDDLVFRDSKLFESLKKRP